MKEDNIIKFKSAPENWKKEFSGIKNNTIRKQDRVSDERFRLIKKFMNKNIDKLYIKIENTETGEIFKREVSDVTVFQDWYLISWVTPHERCIINLEAEAISDNMTDEERKRYQEFIPVLKRCLDEQNKLKKGND